MQKSLLVAAIAAASVGSASPWILGSVAEQQYQHVMTELQNNSTSQISITESHFERGYASSTSTIKIQYDLSEFELPPVFFVIESELTHLPFASNPTGIYFFEVTSKDKVYLENLPLQFQAAFDEHMNGVLMSGYSHINVFGHGGMELSSPAINIGEAGHPLQVTVAPLKITATGNFIEAKGQGLVSLPSASASAEGKDIHLEEFVIKSDFAKDSSGIYVGTSSSTIHQFNMGTSSGPIVFKEITLTTHSESVDDKINSKVTYNVAQIQSHFPVTAAKYDLELNGLSHEVITLLDELKGVDEEQLSQALADPQYILNLANATFVPGLQLNQEFTIDAFGGEIFADLDIEYTGIEGVPLEALANPDMAPKAFEARLLFKGDNEALLRTPAAPAIAQHIEEGVMLVQNDQEISSEIILSQGKLTINGHEIPLEAVLQGIATQMQ